MKPLQPIVTNPRYFAICWVFASLNIVTGTWVLYLPYIKGKFSLNDGEIGSALFCLALGIMVAIPLVPVVIKKIGAGMTTKVGVIVFALVFNLPLMAPNFIGLCASLFLTGIFSGLTDVAMNTLVSTTEKREKQNFMSAAHGFFSLGGFVGAGVGSIFIGMIDSAALHMGTVSFFVILSNLILFNCNDGVKEDVIDPKIEKKGLNMLSPLLGLSIVAFIIMSNEGAVEHWSNLYFFEVVKVGESLAGAGFISFSLCMTVGRFFGDGISRKFGSIKLIVYGCVLALVGYSMILSANFYITVLGYGILGLGLSVIVPELFRLAGKTEGIPSSVAISFVSGVGFMGFLIGPVLLGLISNWTDLTISYIFLSVLVILAIFLTSFHLNKKYNPSKI